MAVALVDRTAVIEPLIHAAAPERRDDLVALWSSCNPTFYLVDDALGVHFCTKGTKIEFSAKTTDIIWLVSFAAWKVVNCIAPVLYVKGVDINDSSLVADPGFAKAQAAFESVLYSVKDMIRAKDRSQVPWPENVPHPRASSGGLPLQDKAAFELSCLAIFYIILHEIRHAQFSKDGNRPANFAEEEMICDVFARDFLIAKLGNYATAAGEVYARVLNKRAAGLAIGAFILHYITPHYDRSGNSEYPPIADRFTALLENMKADADASFHAIANSILIAVIRDLNRPIPSGADVPSAYTSALIRTIREATNPEISEA